MDFPHFITPIQPSLSKKGSQNFPPRAACDELSRVGGMREGDKIELTIFLVIGSKSLILDLH